MKQLTGTALKYTEDCLKELSSLRELLNMSRKTYALARGMIQLEAENNQCMRVSEFVDMCLDIAKIKGMI